MGTYSIHDIGSVPCLKLTVLILVVSDHMFLSQVSYLISHGGFERFPVLKESLDKEVVQAHPCYRIVDSKELISQPELLSNIRVSFSWHQFEFLHLIDHIIMTNVFF